MQRQAINVSAVVRQRFDFGTLYPQRDDSGEPSSFHCQCLISGQHAVIEVRIRFLHLLNRDVLQLEEPYLGVPQDCELFGRPVASLDVDGTIYQTWQESLEREIVQSDLRLDQLAVARKRDPFSFCADPDLEPLLRHDNRCIGVVRREQSLVSGLVETSCQALANGSFKLTVDLCNQSPPPARTHVHCDGHLNQVLASTHILLTVQDGRFVSS